MASTFAIIFEEFEEELAAIGALVQASADPNLGRPRVRVAGANAATLLLAATFEEFVRELARTFAKAVVASCDSYEKLPQRLGAVAWRRTMEALARVHPNQPSEVFSREHILADALGRFKVTYDFCHGDLTQDIYKDLIHNENNMRPQEVNALFAVSGLSNMCFLASDDAALMNWFGEVEQGKAHGQLTKRLEDFFERRNQVAHSINAMRSSGPEQILKDIDLLKTFGRALCAASERRAPTALS